jgi:hypothetical protein
LEVVPCAGRLPVDLWEKIHCFFQHRKTVA